MHSDVSFFSVAVLGTEIPLPALLFPKENNVVSKNYKIEMYKRVEDFHPDFSKNFDVLKVTALFKIAVLLNYT